MDDDGFPDTVARDRDSRQDRDDAVAINKRRPRDGRDSRWIEGCGAVIKPRSQGWEHVPGPRRLCVVAVSLGPAP